MEETSKTRQRTTRAVPLSEPPSFSKEETNLPNDLPTLLSNLRQILQKKNNNKIDSTISQYITSINTKIKELSNLTEPTEIFDALQATLKTYINDLLSITKCADILIDDDFQEIYRTIITVEQTLNLLSVFENNPSYARIVCYRSFDLLSLPVITDFLTEKYPNELFSHTSHILRAILYRIQSTVEYIVFKKNDLQSQIPKISLLVEYVDRNINNTSYTDMPELIIAILGFFWALADDTMLVGNITEANLPNSVLKWISMKDLSLTIQQPCLHIIHNLARHEKGVKALNNANCINILKEFKQRVLDPNKKNSDKIYEELRLVYCMSLSLIAEPKENKEELDSLRKILDQLMQLVINAGQSINDKYQGFHVSEPIIVLTKLFVHDEILNYVLNESVVKNMEATSKVEVFCQLLMKFRGALASENDLDQLTLTAILNIIWSMSFHDQYIDDLKKNSKFLITVKSLANDDGEAWVEQYVPKQLSSAPKAASGILWNLDEDNPARAVRTPAAPETIKTTQKDVKTGNRLRVMVSYCHADKDFCHRLVEALQKDNRLEVWVDFAYCHTEDFWEEIGEAIEKSNVVLFLMSKDYQDSKSCRQEVMYAKDSLKKRFIPIYMKKDFQATGWLGVRIVGPQYVRFEKKSFDDTIKELIKIIQDDTTQPQTDKQKETKPDADQKKEAKPETDQKKETKPPIIPPPVVEITDNQTKPKEDIHIESNLKPSKKPIEQWRKKDITQWFDDNSVHQELIDLYDFQYGTDLLLYGQCLRPDWQIEYNDTRERYHQKYNTQLYRDQFVRLVGAVNRLERPKENTSKLCLIS